MMVRRWACLTLAGWLVMLGAGCPKTGHLRPVPDYSKQGEGPGSPQEGAGEMDMDSELDERDVKKD